jgi:hypothetical protein
MGVLTVGEPEARYVVRFSSGAVKAVVENYSCRRVMGDTGEKLVVGVWGVRP